MQFLFRTILPGIGLFLLILWPIAASGAEWSFTPLVSEELYYNDNYQLSAGSNQSEWGHIFLPEASFAMESERWNLSGTGRAALTRFFKESALNTDEHDLTLSVSLKFTEKSLIHFTEINQVDSTLESELIQTGLLSVWTERNLNTFSIGIDQKMSERMSLNHQYAFTKVSYAGNNLGLNDYYAHSFATTLQDELSERIKLFADAHFSYSQIDGFVTIARDEGVSAGSKYRFSETVNGSLTAGSHWTDSSVSYFGEALESRATGWNLESQLNKEFESGHAMIGITRNIQVSGTGSIVQIDRVSSAYDQRLSERLLLSFNGALSSSQPFSNSLFSPRSNDYRVEGKILWQAGNEVSMTLDYGYLKVDTEGISSTPQSNSAYLMVTWQPNKQSVSR
jgi:hypothetical protein